MRLVLTACLVLGLSACAESQAPFATASQSPVSSGPVTEDPVRRAIVNASEFFSRPPTGQPAAAAAAMADLEFLAQEMPGNPRYQAAPGASLTSLQQARREGRAALGIAPGAPSDKVVSSLRAAATALDAGNRSAAEAALPRDVFTLGGATTLQRLAQPLRLRNATTAFASLSAIPS